MTMTITADRTLELLDQAVANRGADWRYPAVNGSCSYSIEYHNEAVARNRLLYNGSEVPLSIEGQKGACLVGHILIDLLGVREAEIARWETHSAFPNIDKRSLPGIEFDATAINLLRLAQRAQDKGYTWGDAVAFARQNMATRLDWACAMLEDPRPSNLNEEDS
jgi:hypothetical protein